MEYKASLDTPAKVITIVTFVLLLAVGQESVRILIAAGGSAETILIHSGILLTFIVLLLGSWLYAPKSYTLSDSYLLINRRIGKVNIRLSDIKQVRVLTDDETKKTIRTFGVGGLFGYFGKYHTPGIGHLTFYATQRKNKVLILTNSDKKIVITPDDIDLAEKLKQQ